MTIKKETERFTYLKSIKIFRQKRNITSWCSLKYLIAILVVGFLFIRMVAWQPIGDMDDTTLKLEIEEMKKSVSRNDPIHLALVMCGLRSAPHQFRHFLNSMIIMSSSEVNLHIVAEGYFLKRDLQQMYDDLPEHIKFRIKFFLYDVYFPADPWWKRANKPCVTQKLFLPEMIKATNKLIYLDLDIIVTGKIEHAWSVFEDFNNQQIMGAINDCPFPGCGYYGKMAHGHAHVPAVWDSGLNGGVMYMKLDMIRKSDFLKRMLEISKEYKGRLPFAEQDMLNIHFSNQTHTHLLKQVDCAFNYMPWYYCRHPKICDVQQGIIFMHGAGGQFRMGTIARVLDNVLKTVNFKKSRRSIISNIKAALADYKSVDSCHDMIKYMFEL